MAKSILDTLVQSVLVKLTQGSADAFVTAQVATGISTAARFGWLVDSIEWTINQSIVAAPQTADCDVQMQVTQGVAQAAILGPDDSKVLQDQRIALPGIAAAVDAYYFPLTYKWSAPDNFVVVNPLLNFTADSNNTAVACVFYARLFYYPIALQELDILRLIALT